MIRHNTGSPRLIIGLLLVALAAAALGCAFVGSPTQNSDPAVGATASPGDLASPSPAAAADATPGAAGGGAPAPEVPAAADGASPTDTDAESSTPEPPAPGMLADQPDDLDHHVPYSLSGAATGFPPAPDRDPYRLAAELSLKSAEADIPRVVNPNPTSYVTGQRDSIWLVDFRGLRVYQSNFELRLVSPQAYWWVEEGSNVSQRDLEQSAAAFEETIYPRVTAYFGPEWQPGVDHDPHLNIIHGTLRGVGGYFSSADEYPQAVFSHSNQREIIYINTGALAVGSTNYLEVLSHELQHAAHWNWDSSEDTWVNEGLSELAVTVANYTPSSWLRFLQTPTIPLIHWPMNNTNISAHYGGAALFMHYLAAHYSSNGTLLPLVRQPADGIAGIDAYLQQAGYPVTFNDVFRDWVVANQLDEDTGVYGYPDLDVQARTQRLIEDYGEIDGVIPQYAAEYLDLTALSGPIRLRFQGNTETPLLPVDVGPQGCWWSNSGDSIASTLTRAVDLRAVTRATLRYQVWHQLEEDWDFGYVQVSVDGGHTWDLLETPHTSPENPIGNSFGVGYTGNSSGWISESIDLSPYAGRDILLRFQYVTDDAVNGAGLCFRDIAVPEVARIADFANADADWRAEGFSLINNRVRQDFLVQIIQAGRENRVTALSLDAHNTGAMVITPSADGGRLLVAVAALAPQTLQNAHYTLHLEPAK